VLHIDGVTVFLHKNLFALRNNIKQSSKNVLVATVEERAMLFNVSGQTKTLRRNGLEVTNSDNNIESAF